MCIVLIMIFNSCKLMAFRCLDKNTLALGCRMFSTLSYHYYQCSGCTGSFDHRYVDNFHSLEVNHWFCIIFKHRLKCFLLLLARLSTSA